MIEIELDGKKVEVKEGSMVMHAAEASGTYVPHFCYHKKLSIAANCRMCLVDIEKMPKPMPACATPVSQGMIVRTKSCKAINAQKSVMEFLLINHPLDCPICDQGGECQLQDLAVGYGAGKSRYEEEKRVVQAKDIGPLISMEEMSRCIQCTRCVRFGQEVAGVMELGMANRGEHSEIETFLGKSVDSELSGNMIDICPVGALTSKPFRYHARTWELSRRKSIAAHDSSGANLIVQVKNNQVMRVVPFENEEVNECWIADRDRFSYEALNGGERLTKPMIKHGGQWQEVDWETALKYVAHGLSNIKADHGAGAIGALVSPHSTVEELYLATQLMSSLGSGNIDYRLRHQDFKVDQGVRWLGTSIALLSKLERVLVVGSNLRKDHPLFALRIREAVRSLGCQVNVVGDDANDWAMNVDHSMHVAPDQWIKALAAVAASIAVAKNIEAPAISGQPTQESNAMAQSLLSGERKAVLLGNGAAHHVHATAILALANWIAEQTGATCGYLTQAANTVGAQWMGALPQAGGLNAHEMLMGSILKAALLLNTEPVFDSHVGQASQKSLEGCEMVITMSPFKCNLDVSDVLLPIAPFTETSGSFVNAGGLLQSFYSVVKPLGEARPAWKVLRVLANLLELPGFDYESSQEVLAKAQSGRDLAASLSNVCVDFAFDESAKADLAKVNMYQLDGIVRRAPSLQATADAQLMTSSHKKMKETMNKEGVTA